MFSWERSKSKTIVKWYGNGKVTSSDLALQLKSVVNDIQNSLNIIFLVCIAVFWQVKMKTSEKEKERMKEAQMVNRKGEIK